MSLSFRILRKLSKVKHLPFWWLEDCNSTRSWKSLFQYLRRFQLLRMQLHHPRTLFRFEFVHLYFVLCPLLKLWLESRFVKCVSQFNLKYLCAHVIDYQINHPANLFGFHYPLGFQNRIFSLRLSFLCIKYDK